MSDCRWKKNCYKEVKNVAIVGGTHGNELHGIYLVNEIKKETRKRELELDYPSLSIRGVIGNVAAVAAVGTGAGLRYCQTDLNRCFMTQDLADTTICTIEGVRARELNELLGPKASDEPNTDLILDFHSTTANTGILLCCHPQDKFSLQLIAYLQSVHPSISATLWADSEVPLLPSVARSGLTFEVGPIPHSTSNTILYQQTKRVLNDALIYIERHNQWIRTPSERAAHCFEEKSVKLQLFTRFATVGFPRDENGAIMALVHSSLQGAPECVGGTTVSSGDPIFQVLSDGTDIYYIGNDDNSATKNKDQRAYSIEYSIDMKTIEPLYPMFINEAAYNEKNIAFILMHRREVDTSIICVI